jgi:zinc/manganese transport system substrate-binding protein
VHRIQPRPSLIAKARRADLLVCTGADLESAWLPQLLRRANNPGIRPGATGYLEAASQVRLREIPASIDRAEGDLHPLGNPHLHLDPRNLPPVANEMAARLAILDPERGEVYRRRADDFAARWQPAVAEWERRAQPLRGLRVVVDHQQWAYLLTWVEMQRVAALEPKPGLPPSPGYLAELKASLAAKPADLLLRADRHESRAAEWLLAQVSLPEAVLPYTVEADAGGDALFGLFDRLVDGLLEATQ